MDPSSRPLLLWMETCPRGGSLPQENWQGPEGCERGRRPTTLEGSGQSVPALGWGPGPLFSGASLIWQEARATFHCLGGFYFL